MKNRSLEYENRFRKYLYSFDFETQKDILYEGINWSTPSISDLQKKLRLAFEQKEEIKNKKSKIREEVLNFSWKNTAKQIIEFFEQQFKK